MALQRGDLVDLGYGVRAIYGGFNSPDTFLVTVSFNDLSNFSDVHSSPLYINKNETSINMGKRHYDVLSLEKDKLELRTEEN